MIVLFFPFWHCSQHQEIIFRKINTSKTCVQICECRAQWRSFSQTEYIRLWCVGFCTFSSRVDFVFCDVQEEPEFSLKQTMLLKCENGKWTVHFCVCSNLNTTVSLSHTPTAKAKWRQMQCNSNHSKLFATETSSCFVGKLNLQRLKGVAFASKKIVFGCKNWGECLRSAWMNWK